jgi:hypothetical protein
MQAKCGIKAWSRIAIFNLLDLYEAIIECQLNFANTNGEAVAGIIPAQLQFAKREFDEVKLSRVPTLIFRRNKLTVAFLEKSNRLVGS